MSELETLKAGDNENNEALLKEIQAQEKQIH